MNGTCFLEKMYMAAVEDSDPAKYCSEHPMQLLRSNNADMGLERRDWIDGIQPNDSDVLVGFHLSEECQSPATVRVRLGECSWDLELTPGKLTYALEGNYALPRVSNPFNNLYVDWIGNDTDAQKMHCTSVHANFCNEFGMYLCVQPWTGRMNSGAYWAMVGGMFGAGVGAPYDKHHWIEFPDAAGSVLSAVGSMHLF